MPTKILVSITFFTLSLAFFAHYSVRCLKNIYLEVSMILLIDNYDSFSYNLVQYFSSFTDIQVVRNDAITIEEIRTLKPRSIVLSPGPSNPDDAGICLDVVRVLAGEFPIFGVCLGQQIIAQAFGASIVKAPTPVHGKQFLMTHDAQGVFTNIPSPAQIGRYHSLMIDEETLPNELVITAKSTDGVIMGIRHRTLQLEAVQFHPESILTPEGKQMIENFVSEVMR